MSDTIAAIATGGQVSAIGIVRLSGDRAVDIAAQLFTPTGGGGLADREDRRLLYGQLHDRAGRLLDLCLCTVSRAPRSYTGENTAELQCHGSPVLLRMLMEELFALGARQALPGEFTKRAFLNGRLELSSAEAVADLIDAESEEYALNAASQLGGAVTRRTEAIYSALADISAHYHAVLDYPDEDIEDFTLRQYEAALRNGAAELMRLRQSYERGKLLRGGIPTAIVGRPNVGKSSLLNALVGYERAIVTDIPGTTRDTVEERLKLGALTLRLIDTAGLRDTGDPVERLGVERSRRAMEDAALVLAVFDGSEELTADDLALLRRVEGFDRAVVLLSKSDLPQRIALPETALPTVRISAVTGEGLDALKDAVNALFPQVDTPAGEIITNLRHFEAISRALDSMRAALGAMEYGATPDIVLTETEAAMAALGELSGRSIREDVTNRIFARFCVGK